MDSRARVQNSRLQMQDTGMRSELNSDVSGGNERDSALESAVDIKIDRIWWSNDTFLTVAIATREEFIIWQ